MRQKKRSAVKWPRKPKVPGTPKKPRVPKAPKTRCSGTLSEAAYWGWIRSLLRRGSRRWRPIYAVLNAAKRPSKNPNKRLKFEAQCAECKEWFPLSQVSVDHIIPAGSLRCGDDLKGFVERLFVEESGLQVLCTEICHKAKTQRERDERN